MKPPASGLARPSGIGKPSGLAKPSGIAKTNSLGSKETGLNKSPPKDDSKVNTNSNENVSKLTPPKEQVSKISPPKQEQASKISQPKEQISKISQPKDQSSRIASPKEQGSRIASPVTSRKLASPSTPRRIGSPSTPRKIPLPNGPVRRASDGTLGLQTKSRLEVNGSQKKKLSDLSTHEESINEIAERNETRELRYPIVGGKIPDRLGETNRFVNKSLKFQPNPKLTKPTVEAKPVERAPTEQPTASDDETPTNENVVAPPDEFVGESVDRDHPTKELSNFDASETNTFDGDENFVGSNLIENEIQEPTDTEEDTEIEESENEDVRFPENNISLLPEKDPFSEFDTSFDTSQLTGVDEHFDTSKLTGIEDTTLRYEPTETNFPKIKQRPISESDSDIDSDHPKSVYDESEIPKPDYNNLGYAEPDDSIKRSEQLSSDSGYIEPLDTLSSSRNSLPYRKQSGSNASSFPDDISSSNESNPSPRFGEESEQAGSPSHFKRVQPKVMIPPPRINSYTEDLLAPLPKDYMRTPSSDLEECHFVQSHAVVELRRKVIN